MEYLTIESRADGLTVTGELDVRTAPAMRDALHGFAGRAVTLNVAGLTFMDSTGLGTLVSARKTGTVLRTIKAPIRIRLLVQLTGLTEELGLE